MTVTALPPGIHPKLDLFGVIYNLIKSFTKKSKKSFMIRIFLLRNVNYTNVAHAWTKMFSLELQYGTD